MNNEDITTVVANTKLDDPIDVVDSHIEMLCTAWPELLSAAIDNVSLVSDIIQVATQDSEVDPAAVLLTMLGWFGATVGSGPHIKIGDTEHPPRIFTVLVGASSRARKGTSERPIRRLFKMAEEMSGLPKLNVTNGPLSSGEGLIYAVRDPNYDQKPADPGVIDKRLLCIEQEFASVFKTLKRDGNTLSCTVRTSWDGGTISPLTKSHKICATDPHICIVGHITQAELCGLLRDVETWNGFANRFLWGCVQRKKLIPLPSPMNDDWLSKVAQDLSKALLVAQTQSQICFTKAAKSLWEEKYESISQDLPGKLGAITARAEAQVLRLALIYTLLDSKKIIDIPHIQAALAVWQYCSDSAKFLFGNSKIDPAVEAILRELNDGPKTTTQLHKLFNGHQEGGHLQEILNQLQMAGKIKCHKKGGGNRKPASVWELVIR